MDSSQDKNLPPTERRLEKAREDGQVAHSQHLSHFAVLAGGAFALFGLVQLAVDRLLVMLQSQLRFNAKTLAEPALMTQQAMELTFSGLLVSLPFGLLVMALSIGASLSLTGLLITFKPLTPDFSKLNPLSGMGRIFSRAKAVEVAQLTIIIAILAAVIVTYVNTHLQELAALALQADQRALKAAGHWVIAGLGMMLLVIAIVAAIDVPVQVALYKSKLKMSEQEVREEHKESEGNPETKSRRRTRQREIAQRQSIRQVPKADFVVVNPTHYAVALRYDESSMGAPRVVAKGVDFVALKIREVAGQHKVPLLEAPMLARALYAHAEIDEDIPAALYTAVAQVLAYVYRMRAALRGEEPFSAAPPMPEIAPELDPLYSNAQKAART
ncbi:MAG: flagellar biosynthesis protein FlhB [Polaromonas sp.]|jgi:flagellar biosynthetic protein FlhB